MPRVDLNVCYLEIAEKMGELSHCERAKVGAVISFNKRIISTGYNGLPYGLSNNCEDKDNNSFKEVIHAEANAILAAAREGIKLKNSVLYVTMAPCIECAKMIIQSGIQEVHFRTVYRDVNGLELLTKFGIKIIRYE